MSKPAVTFEWKINLTHVLTVMGAVGVMATGYYDLKGEVRSQKEMADTRFAANDRAWIAQKANDDAAKSEMREMSKTLSDQIRELRQDIRADLRDMRQPIGRSVIPDSSPARNLRESIVRERERGG